MSTAGAPAQTETRAVGGVSARSRLTRAGLLAAGIGLTVWGAFHAKSVGASWSAAWHHVVQLGWLWLIGLGVLWFLGLCVHTIVLTASMPGLSHRRALALNLSGSFVANVLPLGGVAGTVLNLGMARTWGHSNMDFARFVVVSKAADLVAKLILPVAAVVALLAWGSVALGRGSMLWLLASLACLGVAALVAAAIAGRARPMLRMVAALERFCRWCTRKVGARIPVEFSADAVRLAETTDGLVRRRWLQLTVGMAGYLVLQGGLLWLCMVAVGVHLSPPVIFAGLVAERVLTLFALTPGGVGLVETGAIAVLIALGTAPTGALAGVLLYRAYIFLAEIPFGGLATVLWLVGRGTTRRKAVTT
ncbi:lysylphosphatidylglycerol synthase transmembrane domain-containing protein [Asanoa iriomotensis]|nr:lysylphosphatidylglycerol synthase domain-containing protein [Asanoa iriomotensis]